MSLSKGSIETLLDLVEIKLGCIEVYDREDARELAMLENCRRELEALAGKSGLGSFVIYDKTQKAGRRGPRAKAVN